MQDKTGASETGGQLDHPVKGQRYEWQGVTYVVKRVSTAGRWADIEVENNGGWSKRQPLPLPAGSVLVTRPVQDWYFTFGGDHTLPTGESLKNSYLVLHGTCDGTRAQMLDLFGNRWAFQYASPQAAGVERYALSELVIPGVTL